MYGLFYTPKKPNAFSEPFGTPKSIFLGLFSSKEKADEVMGSFVMRDVMDYYNDRVYSVHRQWFIQDAECIESSKVKSQRTIEPTDEFWERKHKEAMAFISSYEMASEDYEKISDDYERWESSFYEVRLLTENEVIDENESNISGYQNKALDDIQQKVLDAFKNRAA